MAQNPSTSRQLTQGGPCARSSVQQDGIIRGNGLKQNQGSHSGDHTQSA